MFFHVFFFFLMFFILFFHVFFLLPIGQVSVFLEAICFCCPSFVVVFGSGVMVYGCFPVFQRFMLFVVFIAVV